MTTLSTPAIEPIACEALTERHVQEASRALVRLAQGIDASCPGLLEPDAASLELRRYLETEWREGRGTLDYDVQALAFNKAFFLRNLFKALLTSAWFSPRGQSFERVYDVGSGAGAFGLAWQTLAGGETSSVVFVDRCVPQLRLAKQITTALSTPRVSCRVLSYPHRSLPPEDLRLLSYYLCEQHADWAHVPLRQLRATLGEYALVIDYPETLDALVRRASPHYIATQVRRASIAVPHELRRRIGQDHVRLAAAYLAPAPSEYFRSWREHDVEALDNVFSPTATYHIAPRGITLDGLESIRRYWIRNQGRQRHLHLNYRILTAERSRSRAEFAARFRDIEEGEDQTVTGRIKFRVGSDGRIEGLSEVYEKSVTEPQS